PEPQVGSRWQPWATMISRIFREQDESRRAERRSEAFKSAIVDNALAAIITTDDDGAIVEFNPAAERLFGQQRAQVLGLQVGEVIVPHRLRAAHVAGMKRMREGGTPRVMGRRLEMSALRADGQEIPIEMVLWRTAVEGVAHYTASIADLSERREQARQIERQRDALRQSEKLTAMGSLLAGVAHELNNPLAIVLGRASLLEEKCADRPDLLGDAQRIRDAAERCGRIVRTFLNMARSRPATRGAVSLNDLAQAAADMLGYTYRSHGIELRLGLDAALPTVQADGDQIGQVVLNLLVNAQQVLAGCEAPREVALRTGLAEAGADGGGATVWLRVVDNGPGVPAELREKIFEPFFTTKPEGIGTGLGLAVSRSLAREHGGELCLEDGTPGAGGARPGASFLLSLPLAGAAEAPATPMPAVNPPAALDGDAEARATRVLVVDDESELTDLMRTMLEDAGHEVVTAESGEVALELLAMVEVDVIVSDLRMPDMDGSALWRAVRERHPTLATRMLFVTGDTLSPAARQFLDEARCARLDKPFTREALVAGVAQRLAQP
ncbi:MAG: PAS domain S-box protein, partial [Ideonella sp.]|nr:PAS domain S-box protein [Ideonella sp.]